MGNFLQIHYAIHRRCNKIQLLRGCCGRNPLSTKGDDTIGLPRSLEGALTIVTIYARMAIRAGWTNRTVVTTANTSAVPTAKPRTRRWAFALKACLGTPSPPSPPAPPPIVTPAPPQWWNDVPGKCTTIIPENILQGGYTCDQAIALSGDFHAPKTCQSISWAAYGKLSSWKTLCQGCCNGTAFTYRERNESTVCQSNLEGILSIMISASQKISRASWTKKKEDTTAGNMLS